MRCILYRCSECDGTSSSEAWNRAWWKERSHRHRDPKWNDDDYGPDRGLDEKMVCPRCGHVHADNDTSCVDEVRGVATVAVDQSA
jgi:hypothetical protein